MKLLLVAVWLVPSGILAQSTPSDPWGFIAAYGAAAPFAALCLWMLNRKDKEIELLRSDNTKITEAGMGRVVPMLEKATAAVTDSTRVMEAAMTMIHQIAGRSLSPDELARFHRTLRDVQILLERDRDANH